jgi:hypothetical protein
MAVLDYHRQTCMKVAIKDANVFIDLEIAGLFDLAERLKAYLISGDNTLRKSTRMKGVEIKGTLWVFDLLIFRKMLLPQLAAQNLSQLLSAPEVALLREVTAKLEKVDPWFLLVLHSPS